MADPLRGDIWTVDLDPTRGHEQAGRGPPWSSLSTCSIRGRPTLLWCCRSPARRRAFHCTSALRRRRAACRVPSYIKCEDIRSASKGRLGKFLGRVSPDTLAEVEDRLAILLGMPATR